MREDVNMKQKIMKHYHWIIAAVTFLLMIVGGGVANNRAALFQVPVTEALGISRGDFSLAISIKSLTGFLLSLVSGALFIKFGYRKLVVACMIIAAFGLGMTAFSYTVPMMCIAAALEGASGLCLNVGCPRIIGNWFHRRYGLVMGFVTAATGLGGTLFSILLSKLLGSVGWQTSFILCGVFFAVIAVLVLVLVRNQPKEMGLKPYGEGYVPKKRQKTTADHWEGFPIEELQKKPMYYLLIVATFLSSTCTYIAFQVVAPHVQDCGMDADFAAKIQGLLLLALTGTKLGFGFLSDRFGAKNMTLVSLGACAISLWLLAEISGPISAYIAAIVYAVALPLVGIVPPLLIPSLFGYRSGAKAMGIIISMISAASMVASPISNYLRDAIGSYRPVFRVTALVAVGVMALYLVIYAMAAKERKQFEATQTEAEV